MNNIYLIISKIEGSFIMQNKLKRLQIFTLIITFVNIICLATMLVIFISIKNNQQVAYIFFYISLFIFACLSLIQFFFTVQIVNQILKQKRINEIKGSSILGQDLEEAYNFGEVGLIVTDEENTVIWISEYLENHNIDVLDRNIEEFNPQLLELYNSDDIDKIVKIVFDNRTFNVKCIKQAHLYIFKDISNEENVRNYNAEHEPVIGFIFLDNYQDISQTQDEGQTLTALTNIRKCILNFFDREATLVKQIRNDNYMFITTRAAYDFFYNEHFKVLDDVRKCNNDGYTISIGIGLGIPEYNKLSELASNAMDVALSRGGDQVVIAPFSLPMVFVGGKTEAKVSHNKVKLRVKADSLITLIEHSSNVLVMGHKNADFDALGACFGILSICESLNKECRIFADLTNFESKTRVAFRSNLLSSEERNNITITQKNVTNYLNEQSLIVIVDCNSPSMCLNNSFINDQSKIAVIDHHRPGTDTFPNPLFSVIDTSSSSTCEILTNFISSASKKITIKSNYATFMLTGILLDTNRYRSRTSNYTYDASSTLNNFGASIERADKFLQDNYFEFQLKTKLMSKFTSPYNGVLMCVANDESDPLNPSTIASVAQQGMEISGIQLTIVIGKTDKDIKVSCRSDGYINCQFLMEKLGGGGHFRAAATSYPLETSLDVVKNNVLKVLDDYLQQARNKEGDDEDAEEY